MSTSLSITKNPQYNDELRYEQLAEAIATLPPEEGIRHLKSFLATYPSFATAHNDLGVLYLRAGNGTLALAHHEKAARLQPDNIVFRKNLADFYATELGWLEDATDIYLEVLHRNPRDIEAMLALGKLGEAMLAKKAELTSQPSFDSIAEKPKLPPEHQPEIQKTADERYQEALKLVSSGEHDAAVATLKKLVEKFPNYATAYNDLGILLQQQGQPAEALGYLEQAVSLTPDSTLFRKNLADILYLGNGDLEGAMRQYLRILGAAPKDLEVLRAIAHICIDCGKLEDGIIFLEQALAIQPWEQELREVLRKLKSIAAVPAPAMAQAKSPDELEQSARELLAAGRLEEARDALTTLTTLAPNNAVAHNDLGVVLTQLGEYQQAQHSYERAVELEPTKANFRKNLADLYFTCLGKTDEAIFIYLDMLKSTPRNLEVLLNLGHISSAVGRQDEARIFYRRALELEPWNREAREALRQLSA